MVIRDAEMKNEVRENMRGGPGSVTVHHIVSGEDMPKNCRLFSTVTLEKGCTIGKHDHVGETEVYYGLQGEGVIDDNGELKPFGKGDCNICGGGAYHAISNEKDEPLVFIAVIMKD